jgi:uncharacterized protein YjbI with pentapeptide repeats
MSEEEGRQVTSPPRPTTADHETWKTYWKAQGQHWRTQPEIDLKRQQELRRCLAIVSNVEKDIYPFRGMKLHRADIEWLLAMHDAGRGPVDWTNEQERERAGLDVRYADLRQADLRHLPLTKLRGGLTSDEYGRATVEQQNMAGVLMERANLSGARLEGANLRGAQLEKAYLRGAQLEGANLRGAQLGGANLYKAQLERANLGEAQLGGAILYKAQLERANLSKAQLGGANLSKAQLEGANLSRAQLGGANLTDIKLGDKQRIGPRIADAQWNDTNLAVVDWSQVTKLGDEWKAKQKQAPGGEKKEKDNEYRAAVRANRQLAVALQAQGLNEEAAHFAYRAQRLQRIVLRRQHKFGSYLLSGFLDLLAGYGYRPLRSLFWYLFIILGFAIAYSIFGHLSLFPPDAFIYSLTSFHGRGFFPGLESKPSLHDPLVMLAALEAVIGLFIEISFIATFTQRFFGK